MVAALAAAEAMRRLVEAPSRDLARWAERRLRRPNPRRAPPPAQEPARRGPTWAGEGGLAIDPNGGWR
jgi:hypothetical protein